MSEKLFAQHKAERLQFRTVVQCPHCGFKVTEKMPVSRKVVVFHCPGCNEYSHVSESECCIFCQYARHACPEKQQQSLHAET
ncbi:MAG: hypothetical protein HRU20_09450 [Pseudomonadales bacterium]|nr:hypothetical protein [Pseudomonadales bacterium]